MGVPGRARELRLLMGHSLAVTQPKRGASITVTPMALVAAWLIVGIALNAAQYWLVQRLWLGGYLILAVHALWGAGLLVWMIWFSRQQTVQSAAAMVVLLPTLFFASPTLAFAMVSPRFDRVVSEVAAGRLGNRPDGEAGWAHGVRFATSPGRRDLVVFQVLAGIPDGIIAYVYDGSDAAGQLSRRSSIAEELMAFVSGQPEACEPLIKAHYFLCDFS